MTPRTDQEILDRIEAVKKEDLFGVEFDELALRLSFKAVHHLLREEVKETDWKIRGRDEETLLAEMLDYMPFAWGKANNCRGLSAARSLSHMRGWLFLLGHSDAVLEKIGNYTHYGKPHLRAICTHYGWDWKQWDDGFWRNDSDEKGDPPPETVPQLDEV